jgi:hypothetical protein
MLLPRRDCGWQNQELEARNRFEHPRPLASNWDCERVGLMEVRFSRSVCGGGGLQVSFTSEVACEF